MSSNESFLKLTNHWSKYLREMDGAPAAQPPHAPSPASPTLAGTPARCTECGAPDQTLETPCVYCNHTVMA